MGLGTKKPLSCSSATATQGAIVPIRLAGQHTAAGAGRSTYCCRGRQLLLQGAPHATYQGVHVFRPVVAGAAKDAMLPTGHAWHSPAKQQWPHLNCCCWAGMYENHAARKKPGSQQHPTGHTRQKQQQGREGKGTHPGHPQGPLCCHRKRCRSTSLRPRQQNPPGCKRRHEPQLDDMPGFRRLQRQSQ